MSSRNSRVHQWPVAVIIAVIINLLLFIGIPMLTPEQERQHAGRFEIPIMLMTHKPPKPPDEDRKKLREQKLKKAPKEKFLQRKQLAKPQIKFEYARSMEGLAGAMALVSPSGLKEITAKIGFELSEVDKPPSILSKFPPAYPFGAKREGITGEVLIRCLIGVDGKAGNFKVLRSKPEGVFEECALAAVERWRFKPGILGGEPVPTWVKIPITFELD